MEKELPKKKRLKRKIADLKLTLESQKKKIAKKDRKAEQALLLEKQKRAEKIADLEHALNKAKQKLMKEIAKEQHQAIDHLEGYFDEVDHRYANLREFWTLIKHEIHDLLGHNKREA